jgi:DnaJ-domain-containing protein 1
MPEPLPGEDEAAFIQRCMADEQMQRDFPTQDQRAAVCYAQWRKPPAQLSARASAIELADGQVPAWIMYMPAGVHTIRASQDGQPVEATVLVDRATAERMQASLAAWLAAGRKPYLDLDHDHGGAAGWVMAFAWRDEPQPGVYVQVDWSSRGLEAIQGRVYRYFSPSFYIEDGVDGAPARVIGAPVNMGGLVNEPAFERIAPIWSKRMPHPEDTPKVEAARTELAASEDRTDRQAPADRQQAGQATTETARAIEAAQQRIGELESALQAMRRERAEAAVMAAVQRGAIPAADEELQDRWRKLIAMDPSAVELLARLPGHPALEGARAGQVQIMGEDPRMVLRAYEAARTPLERGRIYARELRPRTERGEPLPIEAANNLGTLAGTLVVQRSLDLLRTEYPILQRISTDFSDQSVNYGQTVVSRIRAIPAAADYNPATGYATQDAVATDVPVTIDRHKAVQIKFTANELAGTSRRLFDEWTEPIHAGLAEAIMGTVYGLITAANYPHATSKALADFGRGTVIDMALALNTRRVSKLNRTLLLNPQYYAKLAADQTIVQLAAYQQPDVITEYRLPRVSGFEPFEAVDLPGAGNLVGAGFAPDAIVFASRLPNDYTQVVPGANYGLVQTVVNPDTGLSVMVTQYIDHALGAAFIRVALMWGVAVGQAASLQRLTSA